MVNRIAGGTRNGPVRAKHVTGGAGTTAASEDTVSAPKVLVREDQTKLTLRPSADTAWQLVGLLGLLFAGVGWLDVLLTWYPPFWGGAEWEFGTVTASFNGLPVPALGMGLLLASAIALGRPWMVRVLAVALAVIAIMLAAAALLYVTNVPIALKTVEEPLIRTGLKKAIVKTLGQSVAYPIVFLWVAVKSWRHAKAG